MKTKIKTKKVADKPTMIGTSKKVSTDKLRGLVKKKEDEKPEAAVKVKKSKKEKVDRTASSRASNYNFPKDCTDPKDRKKFRTTVRKKMEQFEDRLAAIKAGKPNGKDTEKLVNKEISDYKAEVYLDNKEG